jgi:K+-sensing histidine kinase KdpD
MILSRSTRSSHETVHFLLGLVALAALTALCFWLDFRVVSAAFAYLILIVLLSFGVAIIPLAVLSLIAVAALNYFFVTPIFNFRVEYQEDIITLAAFLMTSLVVTGLVKRTRAALVDQVLASEKLREAQMQLTHVNRVATVCRSTGGVDLPRGHPTHRGAGDQRAGRNAHAERPFPRS